MSPAYTYNDDEHHIDGAHGTLAPQNNEAFYDDRSDADDDMEKGRIKFPNDIYGRDRELESLRTIYWGLAASTKSRVNDEKCNLVEGGKKDLRMEAESCDPFKDSRVVFLSGYSGVGKSAVVKEFVKQIQTKLNSSDDASPIVHGSGKYTAQSTVMTAPFSAIAQVLERLAMDISTRNVNNGGGNTSSHDHDSMCSKVRSRIGRSELIGPGTKGNRILRTTFPALKPLLDSCNDVHHRRRNSEESCCAVHPSMNAIKECTCEILSVICDSLDYPLIVFIDDLQWGDEASINMLSFLLSSTQLKKIMYICAYRSNEVHADHSFKSLMENVTKTRSGEGMSSLKTVETIYLFSLPPKDIASFIAGCVKKENADDVSELAEAVYQTTMGNICFVKQALEELVRKNILFYDVMCFEWTWVVSKLELAITSMANSMSDDVVETMKGEIGDLSVDVQNLLVIMAMANIPNTLDVSILKSLMDNNEVSFQESTIRDLLKEASDEGMLLFSVESKNYVFAHDIIRQASQEFVPEKDRGDLLLHISNVLLNQPWGPDTEWCRYVAMDIRNNSLAPDKTCRSDLAELNLAVAKLARERGSLGKENELLQKGLKCLESSGMMWEDYRLTHELYNAVIVSFHSLGSYNEAKIAIEEVLKRARSLDDKLTAYLHHILCQCDQTRDYSIATEEGVRILNIYGYGIPSSPTQIYMMKEEVKLKMALRNCSYSCLNDLQVTDEPIFSLFGHVMKNALFASKERLLRIIAWKAIQFALKKGVDRYFPRILAIFGTSLAKQGKAKTAHEVGNIALALSEKIRDDTKMYALTKMMAYSGIMCQLHSFRSVSYNLLQCYKDLKLTSNVEPALGSMLNYFHALFAGGLELGPVLESKLRVVEEYCQDRTSFLMTFQMLRQFALNLRKRTENPTKFEGEAFHEEEHLNRLTGEGRSMALRDSSSYRLQLAFIFWDEECMVEMLQILVNYSLTDQSVARLHNRLCFMGLAAIALGRIRRSRSFHKLGQNCLSYFAHLAKHGSVNARPVYLFMLAMKRPSREAFKKAIDACAESNLEHLEAMANERYAAFLNEENDVVLANDCIALAYWQYRDWGADAKALELSKSFDFLKNSKRQNARSFTLSNTLSSTYRTSWGVSGMINRTYSYNTTFRRRHVVLVEQ